MNIFRKWWKSEIRIVEIPAGKRVNAELERELANQLIMLAENPAFELLSAKLEIYRASLKAQVESVGDLSELRYLQGCIAGTRFLEREISRVRGHVERAKQVYEPNADEMRILRESEESLVRVGL